MPILFGGVQVHPLYSSLQTWNPFANDHFVCNAYAIAKSFKRHQLAFLKRAVYPRIRESREGLVEKRKEVATLDLFLETKAWELLG